MSTPIETNTDELRAILDAVNELPSTDGFVRKTSTVVVLPASGWVNSLQNIAVDGVTEDSDVFASPAESSYDAYCEAGVRCSGQADNALTFYCKEIPAEDLTVNVIMLY